METRSNHEVPDDTALRCALRSLKLIRDNSQFSARNSSKGALVKETFAVFQAIANGLPVENVRRAVLEGRLLFHRSYETRRSIWNHVNRRYFTFKDKWITMSLADASKEGMSSPNFLSLSYLYYVLRDRLTFRFVTGPLWELWKRQVTAIEKSDVVSFLSRESQENPIIDKWYDSTRMKLANNMLSALRDFGVLTGVRRKKIQSPTIAPETVFHLVSILTAENLKGQRVVDAPDWRMFLWDAADVARALNDLSFRGWIAFEKTGRTVILELKRLQGSENESAN
jgi:hypothetical protein